VEINFVLLDNLVLFGFSVLHSTHTSIPSVVTNLDALKRKTISIVQSF